METRTQSKSVIFTTDIFAVQGNVFIAGFPGFSLLEILHREKPCFHNRDGFAILNATFPPNQKSYTNGSQVSCLESFYLVYTLGLCNFNAECIASWE